MKFNAEDAVDRKKAKPGQYTLEVHEAEERTSSSGNPMIALVLKGQGVTVRDYLVGSASATWKVKQFCLAAGLREQFAAGRLTEEDVLGRVVVAVLDFEKQPPGSQYDPRLVVTEYLESGESVTANDIGADPDIPF
jgi:hypothetical protein